MNSFLILTILVFGREDFYFSKYQTFFSLFLSHFDVFIFTGAQARSLLQGNDICAGRCENGKNILNISL